MVKKSTWKICTSHKIESCFPSDWHSMNNKYIALFCTWDMVLSCLVMSQSLWPHGVYPSRLLCPWYFPGKNTGVGCHFLLQVNFSIQGSNPGLLPSRQILYWLSHQGSLISHLKRKKHWCVSRSFTTKLIVI